MPRQRPRGRATARDTLIHRPPRRRMLGSMHRWRGRLCAPTRTGVLMLTLLVGTATPLQGSRGRLPREAFVTVNGVRLHYVDWGGSGEPLLFLTPLGGASWNSFRSLPRRFTDRFRVLGLTRRGQAPSEAPATGYDVDTLVGDLVAFLDAMGIRRVNIAGHSIAGSEMTRFAGTSSGPRLEAGVSGCRGRLPASCRDRVGSGPRRLPGIRLRPSCAARVWRRRTTRRSRRPRSPSRSSSTARSRSIRRTTTRLPALPSAGRRAGRVVGNNIALFRRDMKRGTVLTFGTRRHGGFLTDPVQLAIFVPAMRAFLLGSGSSGESSPSGVDFTAHTIDTGLAGGYQVVVADLNRDGKPDIIALASGLKELRWYENPGWQRHVLVTGIDAADQRRRVRRRRRRHSRDRARARVLERVREEPRASSRS